MTIAVDLRRKATKQTNKQNLAISLDPDEMKHYDTGQFIFGPPDHNITRDSAILAPGSIRTPPGLLSQSYTDILFLHDHKTALLPDACLG